MSGNQQSMDRLPTQLADEGFAILHDCLTPDMLKRLRKLILPLFVNWSSIPDVQRKLMQAAPSTAGRPVREINWPRALLPAVAAEPAVAKALSLLASAYGRPATLFHANALLKPGEEGDALALHQDTAYGRPLTGQGFTAWIPLCDVAVDNGTLYYLPGSHLLGDLAHSGRRVRALESVDEQRLTDLPRVAVVGSAGLVAYHDSRIVHGSFPNQMGEDRPALSLRIHLP